MYLPDHFREPRREVQIEFILTHPLGLLISSGAAGLVADSVPFCLYPDEGAGGVLRAHVARANPQWRILTECDRCLVVFQGPEAYVRPGWYASKREHGKVVPTWNYAAVHIEGRARIVAETEWLWRQLNDLTRMQEQGRPEPWAPGDAPPDFVAAQMKAIVGIEIAIERMEGKWKMSQNKDAADRAGVVAGLSAEPDAGSAAVARLVAERAPILPRAETPRRPDGP